MDDLGVEVVFPDGWAVFGLDAFAGHAGAHDFGQTVNVHRVNVHAFFDGSAHVVGPGLGAKDADAQRAGFRVDALALKLIGNRQHVAGRDHDDVGLEVLDQLHLALGLTTAKRHHGEAQFFSPVVRAHATGEQAIAITHMHHVTRLGTACADAAGHHRGPGVDVFERVAHHRGLAGGAAGRVDAGALLSRHGEHAKGVAVAQIRLGGEGKLGDVGQRLAVARVHASGVELGAVHGRVGIGVLQGLLQALELQAAQLVDAGFFNRLQGEGFVAHEGLRIQQSLGAVFNGWRSAAWAVCSWVFCAGLSSLLTPAPPCPQSARSCHGTWRSPRHFGW